MIVASDPDKDLSLLKYLIDFGANIFIKDNSGKAVENYAKSNSRVIKYLNIIKQQISNWFVAINQGQSPKLELKFINARDKEGRTALFYAKSKNQYKLFRDLLA